MAVIQSNGRPDRQPAPGIDPADEPTTDLPPISDELAADPFFQAAQAKHEPQTEDNDTEPVATETQEPSGAQEPIGQESDPDPTQETQPEDDPSADPAAVGTEEEDEVPVLTYGGHEYQAEDVQRMVALDQWATSLQPEHRAAIDALFSGQYQLVPIDQVQQYNQQQQPAPTPTPSQQQGADGNSPIPGLSADDLEDLPPAVVTHLQSLNARLEETARLQNQQLQAQQQAQAEQISNQILEGQARFQTTYELTDPETAQLQDAVLRSGILPSIAPQFPGNPAMAMEKAMETIYWSDSTWRQRELNRIAANGNQDPNATATAVTKQRARKASALNGSGGNGASREQPAEPTTKEGRRAAMTTLVREEMFGGHS